MSRADDPAEMIGVNWGSSNFRAYRIGTDGSVDEYCEAAGVAALSREEMAAMMDRLAARWPHSGSIYVSGMIGSTLGWTEVDYAEAPVGCEGLAAAAVATTIGGVRVRIVPGIACTRGLDGTPDVLRGEEIELVGLAALREGDGLVALPGPHTKWARLEGGEVVEFFTSMSGEIFERLTEHGLLASIVEGAAFDGPHFRRGVTAAAARQLGLATLLFGARALVVRGAIAKSDAASYLRGLLIGSEIADALLLFPSARDAVVRLVGSEPLCHLYAGALATLGVESRRIDAREARLRGFRAVHEASFA